MYACRMNKKVLEVLRSHYLVLLHRHEVCVIEVPGRRHYACQKIAITDVDFWEWQQVRQSGVEMMCGNMWSSELCGVKLEVSGACRNLPKRFSVAREVNKHNAT